MSGNTVFSWRKKIYLIIKKYVDWIHFRECGHVLRYCLWWLWCSKCKYELLRKPKAVLHMKNPNLICFWKVCTIFVQTLLTICFLVPSDANMLFCNFNVIYRWRWIHYFDLVSLISISISAAASCLRFLKTQNIVFTGVLISFAFS